MEENENIILVFLAMGHIFRACSVSNEMVEIFVENEWFYKSFAVRKQTQAQGWWGKALRGGKWRAARLFL